jgi:hypothetical protein
VKPARCNTDQNRLLVLEKLYPSMTALAAGFRPQNTTSRFLSRISGRYLLMAHVQHETKALRGAV